MAWELESKNQLEDTTKTAQPNWEFEPVKIPNQTVLDDKTGEAYSVPVTMDGTDTQFAIDTQTKGEDKNNYFAKVSMITGFNPDDFVKMGVNNAFGKKVFEDVQSPVEMATSPARSVARGVVDFVGGFSTLADSFLKGERETREYKYMLEQRKKGEQSFLKDLGNTLSNVGIGGLQIKRFSNLYKAYTTPKEDLDRAIESASKVIDTIEKSKKQKRDFFKNVGESIITDKELAQNKTLGVIRDLSSATASVGTSVAATVATKNPTVAAAIVATAFGLQQSEESYEKAIEGGYDPYTARAYGDIQGGLNAALEFMGTKLLSNFAHLAPIKKLTDSSSKLIMKKLLTNKGTLETAKKIGRAAMKRGYLKDVALSGLGESWEEISQSLAVDIGDNIMGLESFSLGEIISRALYNGAIAIIPSAGTGAVGGIAYNRKINQIHNNLMQQAQQLAPDLTQQEASNFADAAMEVLYQQSADYADATNEIVQKELDPDTIPDNPQTPQELSDNMERILRETYGYSDEEIKKMVDTLNKSIDTSHQYADTYNQLYNALTGAGRSAAESDQASRLFAARALTIAQAEGTTADEVVKRWHLQFKGHQYKYMPADIAEKAKADKSGDMSQYIEQAEQEYNKVLADNNIDYTSMDFDEKAKQAAMFIKTAPVDATLNAPVSDEMLSEVDWVQQDELAKQQDLARTMYQLDQVGTEYTGETININGQEKTVYNSNGDRIAKSEEALRAFYNWFGDSKVVDGKGRPLVVYHGTRAGRKFSVFRTEKTAWVSPNKSYAGAFTTKSFYDTPHENKIFSLYVRLKNPLYVGDIDGIADPKAIKRLSDDTGLSVENLENMKTGENIFTITNTEAFKKAIQEKGYDGLEAIEGRTKSFGVFDPNQIKSTSNRGTYSLTDNNIYNQSAYAGSRVDYDKPSLEAIGSGEGNQAHGWGLYYALNRDVAEGYRETFTQDKFVLKYGDKTYTKEDGAIFDALNDTWFAGSKEDALDGLQTRLDLKQYEDFDERDDIKSAIEFLKGVDANKIELAPQGQVHEVDIPESPYLLDEQKSFDEQSDYVKEKLRKLDIWHSGLEDLSGGDIYKNIAVLGTQYHSGVYGINNAKKLASKMLEDVGIKGITYFGEQDGRCFVIFNPDDVKVIRKFYQVQGLGKNAPVRRGSYTQRGKFNIIELFQTANPSTIIHEMAHFFLNDLRMYQDNPTTKRQLNAIYKYVGSTDGNITTEQHEYFARSFEAYLMEGKAPNNTLKQVFNRFKNWLTRIYREVKTLDVQLDDNIRSVFDEMLGGKSLDYSLNKGRSNFDERVLSGEIKPSAVKERIARLLKWAEPRTRGGKVVGRFPDIKINQQFDYIREKIGMDKTEAQSKIEDNTKLIDAIIRGDETGDIDALAWENKLLGIAAGKTNARLLLDVYNSVSEMYNTGRFAESVTGSLKKARRQRMLNTLMNTIEQGAGAEWRKGSSKLKQAIRNIGRSYTGWNGLLDMLSMYDKGSKVGESALNQMYSVYDEELNMRYNVAKDGELLSDILGKKLKSSDPNGISVSRYINGLQKKTLIEWGANSKEFTKDEIIDIYMKAKDEETRKIMLEDDILQYNEEFLARIDENMTTEDIAFAESLFEFYDKTYEKLNNFYADHYGVVLGKRKYYSPRSMDRAGIDVSTGDLSSYAGLSNVKKRTAKGGAIKIKGAYNVLNSYIANSNHWMAFADKLIDINSGFGDTKVKNIIRSVWGEDMNKRIAQEISRFATNDKAFAQKFDGWFSKLRANYAVSVLGAKPSITIKQLVSFPAYWENMSAKEFVAGVVDFARHPKQAIETLSKSKLMQTRGVNIIRDLEIVSNSERLKNLGTKTGFREFLMLNVQLGDRGAIYLGGWAVYKKVLAETGSTEKAMAAFEKVTNETQQSSFMSEQSSWQSNPFGALFTMFQSSQNQYLRKEINAVRGLLTGRMDAQKVGKTLFIYHFLLPMLFQFVSDGFRWDKDKQFRAATLGSLNGAFILGDMLDRIADFFITKQLNLKKDVSELIPFLTTIQNTAKFISKTAQFAGDDISLEDYVEALGRFSQSVGEFTGLPIKYIKDVALNTDDYLEDEEYTKAGLLWLGWSPYALRDINNE